MAPITPLKDVEVSNSSILAALSLHESVHSFEPGAVIFAAGTEPGGVHVLLSGEVDLEFKTRKEQSVRFGVTGQILGLSSIVSGRTHEYTACARQAVITGYVSRDVLLRILHSSPELWFDVLQVLSRDISSCYDRVKELAGITSPASAS